MRSLGIQLCLVIISLSMASHAEVVTPPSESPPTDLKSIVEANEIVVPTDSLVLSLSPGIRQASLRSSSFEGTPSNGTQLTFASILRVHHSHRQSLWSFELGQTEYRGVPTSISPDLLRENRLFLRYENLTDRSMWHWGPVVLLARSRATETSPHPLLASRLLLWTGLAIETQENDNQILNLRLTALIPIIQHEESASSGEGPSGFRLEGGLNTEIYSFHEATLCLGIEYNLEKLTFRGTGERGSLDPTETLSDLRIPISLQWTWH